MKNWAKAGILIVALIHLLLFPYLEATQWDQPRGLAIHHLDQSVASATVGVGQEMALYNAFVGAGLLWSLGALRRKEAFAVQLALLAFIAVAGVVGCVTIGSPKILISQTLPALVTLVPFWLSRPGTKTEHDVTREIVEIERALLNREVEIGRAEIGRARPDRVVPPVARRGQHSKQIGCVKADFIVADDVPEALRFGVFREPKTVYTAWIRFSNARVQDDSKPGGHGMAIKLLGVPGPKLMVEATESQTQDFVLFDHPVFFIPDPFDYAEFESALLRAQGKKLSLLLHYFWSHPLQFQILRAIQRHPPTNPLENTYWSTTPYRLGPSAVKYSARPVLAGDPVTAPPSKDMLREAMKRSLDRDDAVFHLGVQVQSDPDSMPVEDATRQWDEARVPFKPIATVRIHARQPFDSQEQSDFGEHLSFTPWHGLPEHEPLGGINRVRRAVYESLSALRHELNGVPRCEPPLEARPPA